MFIINNYCWWWNLVLLTKIKFRRNTLTKRSRSVRKWAHLHKTLTWIWFQLRSAFRSINFRKIYLLKRKRSHIKRGNRIIIKRLLMDTKWVWGMTVNTSTMKMLRMLSNQWTPGSRNLKGIHKVMYRRLLIRKKKSLIKCKQTKLRNNNHSVRNISLKTYLLMHGTPREKWYFSVCLTKATKGDGKNIHRIYAVFLEKLKYWHSIVKEFWHAKVNVLLEFLSLTTSAMLFSIPLSSLKWKFSTTDNGSPGSRLLIWTKHLSFLRLLLS